MLIRPAVVSDALGLAKVHVDTWRSSYRGIVADSFLDGLTYEAMQGVLSGRRNVEIHGQSLEEVAYGWQDIHVLTR